jgi:hypothetical protein
MKINDILTESQQQELEEGPLLNKIGSAVGKAVGGVARGVGAVAGGVAGAATAAKQGFQTGKAAVTGKPDPNAVAPTTAAGINTQGPKGTAAAKTQTGAGAQALQKSVAATSNATADQAGQTVYAQVKANIDKLDKKGKQRIMQLLQKSVATPAPNTMANAPVSATNVAKPGNPNAVPAATAPAATTKPATAAPGADPAAALKNKKVAAKPKAGATQAEIDADRERLMGVTSDSVIRTGNSLEETLARKVEEQKRKMFESNLRAGRASVFVK